MKFFDFFFVLRPVLFLPGCTTTLAAIILAKPINLWESLPLEPILILLSSSLLIGSIFLINQLKDIETDRINKKLFFISEGMLTRRFITTEILILISLAFAISFSVSMLQGFLHAATMIIEGWVYNLKPFEAKNRPILGLLCNAFAGLFFFSFGWFLYNNNPNEFLIAAIPYICFNSSLCLLTTIPDIEGDIKTGKKTWPVRYGLTSSVVTAFILYFLGILSSLINKDYNFLFVTLAASPWMAIMLFKPSTANVIRAVKFSIFIFFLMISAFFPAFFIFVMISFFFSRFYYKKRFGIIYPSFRGQ